MPSDVLVKGGPGIWGSSVLFTFYRPGLTLEDVIVELSSLFILEMGRPGIIRPRGWWLVIKKKVGGTIVRDRVSDFCLPKIHVQKPKSPTRI